MPRMGSVLSRYAPYRLAIPARKLIPFALPLLGETQFELPRRLGPACLRTCPAFRADPCQASHDTARSSYPFHTEELSPSCQERQTSLAPRPFANRIDSCATLAVTFWPEQTSDFISLEIRGNYKEQNAAVPSIALLPTGICCPKTLIVEGWPHSTALSVSPPDLLCTIKNLILGSVLSCTHVL